MHRTETDDHRSAFPSAANQQTRQRSGLHDGVIVAAGALLSIVPLLWPRTPPLLDLPGHMGGFHLALNLSSSPALQRYYTYQWHLIGNLGVDMLVDIFGPMLGIELATKCAVILIPLITVTGFLWAAHEAHGRIPATAAVALPLAYCYPFHYGFVNYCLATGFAALAFALWLRLGRQGRFRLRAGLFFAIAPLVWVAHAIGWVLLGALCAAAELRLQRERGQAWPHAIAMTVATCLPLAWPILLQLLASNHEPLYLAGMFDGLTLAKWAVTVDRDRWILFDLFTAAIMYGTIGLAALGVLGLRFRPLLLWPALAAALLFVVLPQGINGSAFVSARVAPFAVAYALLAIDTSRVPADRRQIVAMGALAFFLLRLTGTTVSLALYDQTWRQALAALDMVRPGSAIAVFDRQACKAGLSNWANPRLQHLGGLALLRRNAFVNDQFATDGLQLVGVHYAAATLFQMSPSEVVTLERCRRSGTRYWPDALQALPRQAFQYVWLLNFPAATRPRLPWLKPLQSTPLTALYAVLSPPASGQGAQRGHM